VRHEPEWRERPHSLSNNEIDDGHRGRRAQTTAPSTGRWRGGRPGSRGSRWLEGPATAILVSLIIRLFLLGLGQQDVAAMARSVRRTSPRRRASRRSRRCDKVGTTASCTAISQYGVIGERNRKPRRQAALAGDPQGRARHEHAAAPPPTKIPRRRPRPSCRGGSWR